MSLRKIILGLLCAVIFGACVEHSKDALHSSTIQVNATEALEYLQDLAEDSPDNPEVFYQLGRIYFREADYNQALKNVKEAIAMKQDNAEYQYLSGKIYHELNEPDRAIKALLLAEGLGKKNHEVYRTLTEAYLQLGQAGKAREAIDRLTSMNESADAYALKGEVMLSLGDTALAVGNYNKALIIDRKNIASYVALADISIARQQEERAIVYVNQLLDLEPAELDFLIRKADLLQRIGELDSARQLYRTVVLQRGNYLDFYRLSNVYYLMRKYDSARHAAQEAFQRNNKFLNAQLVVARSLDKARKYSEAIEVYEMIVTADSTFNLAVTELDNLRRKVAYLWRLREQRQAAFDSAKNNPPATVEKKEIDDN
ncbi:MAG: tetratricopeptide repeat protein [Fulvivirga sp.]